MIVPNLKISREDILEIKQKDVAKFMGVSPSTVSGWENGIDTIPLKRLVEYANAYNLSLDYLFGIKNIPKSNLYIKIDNLVISKNLRKLRKANGMTQLELSKKTYIDRTSYSKYETGKNLITTTALYSLIKVYPTLSIEKLFF